MEDNPSAVNICPLINKLDHSQEEVRTRALDNIINKLNYGIVSALDLACNRNLISNLLKWFNKPAPLKPKECLGLLLKICSQEVGAQTLFALGGVEFLQALKSDLSMECQPLMNDILEQIYIKCRQTEPVEVALHYDKSGEERRPHKPSNIPRTKPANHKDRTDLMKEPLRDSADIRQSHVSRGVEEAPKSQSWYSKPDPDATSCGGFVVVEFPWITLSPTDIHVLQSTNQSLVSADAQLITSACDFLVDVMLFDFPAEIFLQRPIIVKTLVNLLNNLSNPHKVSDVALSLVDTLNKICDSLKARVNFHKDPATFAPKQDILALNPVGLHEDSIRTSHGDSSDSQCSRPSVVGLSDEKDDDQSVSTSTTTDGHRTSSSRRSVSVQMTTPNIEELELQELQLLLPDYCIILHKAVVNLLDKSNNRLELELHRLLMKLQELLKLSVTSHIWTESSQYARDLCDALRLEMHSMARVAVKCHQMSNSTAASSANQVTAPAAAGSKRLTYIILSQLSLDMYKLIPSDKYNTILGASERQLMYTLCCDESLAQSMSSIRCRAAKVLQVVDSGSHDIYTGVKVVCDSMEMYCNFLLNAPAYTDQEPREILRLLSQAEKAIYSVPYHMNKELIPALVNLCSRSWSFVESKGEVTDYMMNVLLKYMAHPVSSIRKETYQSVVSVLKASLSFDAPTQSSAVKMKFITHHSLLWEVACFGLSSDISEIMSSSQDIFNYLMQCRMLVSADMWAAVCKSLLPILPVLQSYASPDLTLGKCVLAFLDTHFDTNISTVSCVKGAMRVLFCRDTASRMQAVKVLMTQLNSHYSSYLLYPLTETKRYEGHLMNMECLVREQTAEGTQRSILNEESVTRVLRVFLSDRVEHGVKLTSLNQLAVILQNPHTHKYYLEQSGLELTLTLIKQSIIPDRTAEDDELITPAISILTSLLQYNPELRQTLAADLKAMLTLLRCCWLFPSSTKTSVEAAQCITYIVFDEISPKCSSSVFSLPKICCVRYKFPLRVMSYCDISTHRIEGPPTNDPITQSLPLQMLRIFWNITWHGKVEQLLESIDKQQLNSGSDRLNLTEADIRSLKDSSITYTVFNSLESVTNATSHNAVAQELGVLTAYSLLCKLDNNPAILCNVTWYSYFERFLMVHPVATMDKELLVRIVSYFTTLLNLRMPHVTENLLTQLSPALSDKNSVLLSLLLDSAYTDSDANFKRPLQNCLLTILGMAGIHNLTDSSSVRASGRNQLVRSVLKRLTMADASNFYNLASLESSVYTLLRLTSRPKWSYGCADIDSRSLCTQLIKALFEVLSAFHLGRQGNSLSYMGKGVLRNATLCLRHVVQEMTSSVIQDNDWISPWIEGGDGQSRLEWLRSLWSYRDQEVRAAALGVSVALAQSPLGLEAFDSVSDMVSDAASIVIDTTECSLVRRQAAILITNLIITVHLQQAEEPHESQRLLSSIFGVLQSQSYFSEVLTILSSDLFTDSELNMDSLHRQIRPETGDSICNVVYPTLALPGLLSSILDSIITLTAVTPKECQSELQQAGILDHLTRFFDNSSLSEVVRCDPESLDQSEKLMRCDLITLCEKVVCLLRHTLIQSKQMRSKLLLIDRAGAHVNNLLSVLSTGTGYSSDLAKLWCETLQYLSVHLHTEPHTSLDRVILPNATKHWSSITGSCIALLKSEKEEQRICVLEFWAILLSLCYDNRDENKLKTLLDGEKDGAEGGFGSTLTDRVLHIYDTMMMRYADKECIQERLATITCMKTLVAISQSAKSVALEAGLVESLLSHMDSFVGKLNLLATSKLGSLHQEGNVCLAELVVSLEIITNFMLRNDEVKQAVSSVGLANLIHRMWFYCESDSQLMMTALSTLITYTQQSTVACRHMVCTSTVSCLGMEFDKLLMQSNSLADILVKLTHSQLNKININLDMLTRLFKLMCNFALSPDTLSVICKNTLASGFSSCNPKVTIKRKPKLQSALTRLWLELFLNLSYSTEGQKLILAVPDCLGILVDNLETCDSDTKEFTLIILYNLCVGYRSKILSNDCVPLCALRVLQDTKSTEPQMDYATSILQAIIYDNMKGKALVKGLTIPERLEELLCRFRQESSRNKRGDSSDNTVRDSIKQLLIKLKE